MKSYVLLIALLTCSFTAKADQLAYLSKADTDRAAAFIGTQSSIYLFCGCCDNDIPVLIHPVSVEVKYTGYEDYYEIIVSYTDASGTAMTESLDLAYTWVKAKRRKYKTVGAEMNLGHDPCAPFPLKK